jgi:hypothetical protein
MDGPLAAKPPVRSTQIRVRPQHFDNARKSMTSRLIRSVIVVPILLMTCVWVSTASLGAGESCTELGGKVISASAIGLPSTGASVRSAIVVQASQSVPVEYCKVLGVIRPVDPTAPDIGFQVNLPAVWNGKAVQYGGGGFNGTLITADTPLRGLDVPPNMPPPLARESQRDRPTEGRMAECEQACASA